MGKSCYFYPCSSEEKQNGEALLAEPELTDCVEKSNEVEKPAERNGVEFAEIVEPNAESCGARNYTYYTYVGIGTPSPHDAPSNLNNGYFPIPTSDVDEGTFGYKRDKSRFGVPVGIRDTLC